MRKAKEVSEVIRRQFRTDEDLRDEVRIRGHMTGESNADQFRYPIAGCTKPCSPNTSFRPAFLDDRTLPLLRLQSHVKRSSHSLAGVFASHEPAVMGIDFTGFDTFALQIGR